MSTAPVSKAELLHTNAAMLAMTSVFILARIGIQVLRRKAFEVQDFFIYFAYFVYLALWICYRIVIDPMFRAYAVYSGESPSYPTMMADASQMLRLITAAQMCFYTSLVGVKLSLLTLYRKLLRDLPNIYYKIWWSIVGVCILVSNSDSRILYILLTLQNPGLAAC
jgi:hypothetical protein